MAVNRQVLFIQGGGEGAHDSWDHKLVASLRRELGEDYEVRYPRMPVEEEPDRVRWGTAINLELENVEAPVVVVGHSVGGALLIGTVAEETLAADLRAIILIDAPFVGAGGWRSDDWELPEGLGDRLHHVPVHVFHGLADETVAPAHAELYRQAIPGALVHLLPNRDHQLNNDLSEIARTIRSLRRSDPGAARRLCSPSRQKGRRLE